MRIILEEQPSVGIRWELQDHRGGRIAGGSISRPTDKSTWMLAFEAANLVRSIIGAEEGRARGHRDRSAAG